MRLPGAVEMESDLDQTGVGDVVKPVEPVVCAQKKGLTVNIDDVVGVGAKKRSLTGKPNRTTGQFGRKKK